MLGAAPFGFQGCGFRFTTATRTTPRYDPCGLNNWNVWRANRCPVKTLGIGKSAPLKIKGCATRLHLIEELEAPHPSNGCV